MRQKLFMVMLVAGWTVLGGRLGWLTLVRGGEARGRADNNRIEVRQLMAPRGLVTDRNGEALVRNMPGDEPDKIKRDYMEEASLAHVLGYVGESEQEIGRIEGKMGIEKWADEKLRGIEGAELVETDAVGKILRRLGKREPVAGEEVRLTIDAGLQRQAFEALGGRRGAVVISNVGTGEILALVSSPSFDPSRPAEFVDRPDKPFFNRAVGGEYPPGSVFKLVTAVAGLEEGKVTEISQIEDTGEIRVGEFRYGNWYFDQYGRKEGALNLVGGLRRSNDVFFYRVGEAVGPEKLAEWARRLGLGRATGWELGGEGAGLVPDPDWKEKFKGERWFLGNTYHLAIGQGDVAVTPVQINLMIGAIGTGRLCRPVVSYQSSVISKQDCEDLNISQKTLELVRQGMTEACSPGGTAFPLFGFEPQVACKTGTAQHGGKETLPHAWFTVLAPATDPEIAVTVLLEAAGEGSYEAAPVAKGILEYWFHQRQGR